ncbi:hypothetical protein A6S26_27085 [Nostoc sp. ATCC 43529]|nr:hypothetical protein A6S26_27085 [Nostoc sp. ATCC 43529]
MNQQHFNAVFNGLTERRREVLLKLLANEKDEAIAKSLHIQKSTVRKHREEICKLFGLNNEFPDERRSKLPELIALFAKYKPELLNQNTSELSQTENFGQDKTTSEDPNFVGREEAIAHLDMLIDKCNPKVIGIYGKGGIGKTRLAYHYLDTQKLEYLELQVGMEAQCITSVKSWVKDQLRYQFQEEPEQDFISTLEQLKRKLQKKPVNILIDNLETALDENGKFKKEHIDYLELFMRVLNAPNVKSITLITSRERLNEAKLSFVEAYQLLELNEIAWRKFFSKFDINVNCPAMSAIHQSYGGNALCMKVIREPIQRKYNGDLEAYWQENKEFLLKGNIKDLVASQFDRIQNNNIDVYNLLCRLGLYTYQKIPYIAIIGLLCLLWDVQEEKKRSIIDSLEQTHLLEFRKERIENISNSWQDRDSLHLDFPPSQGWMFNLEIFHNEVKLLIFQPAGYSLHKFIWEEAKSRLYLSNQSIEYLLFSLKTQIDKMLIPSETCQNFLNFIYQKEQILFCTFTYKKACIRSAYIQKTIKLFSNLADEIDPTFYLDDGGASYCMDMHLAIDIDISFEIAQDINSILTFLYCFDQQSVFWEVGNRSGLSDIDFVIEILPGIKRVLSHKQQINSELYEALKYIESLVPENVKEIRFFRALLSLLYIYKPELVPNIRTIPMISLKEVKAICGAQLRTGIEEFEKWFKVNGQKWINTIADVMFNIPHIDISAHWQFSEQEKQQFRQYYDANRLLVDCLKNTSDKVRSQIEDTLLLPITEIEKRPFKD